MENVMKNAADVSGLSDEQLVDTLTQFVASRAKVLRSVRLYAVVVFALGVATFLLPLAGPWRSISILGLGLMGVVVVIWLSSAVRVQESLDAAVIEVRRRERSDLVGGIVLEPMDGNGFMPKILIAETALLTSISGFAVWMAMLFTQTNPLDAFLVLGLTLTACFLVTLGWAIVLLVRGGALKARPDKS